MAQIWKIMFRLMVILLSYEAVAFQQSDYNLTNERMDLIEYDKKWFQTAAIKNFKYNRTHAVINISFVTAHALENPEIAVQAYRFASNEYRLFPLTFKLSVCSAFAKNDFGIQNMFLCGNFTGCPILKRSYQICNWIPDESQYPPYIPSGRYMIELKLLQGPEQFGLVQWYIKIEKRFHYV